MIFPKGLRQVLRFVIPFIVVFSPLAMKATDHGKVPPQTQEATTSTLPPLAATAKKEIPVQARLISEESSIQAGHPFWVGVELQMAEGWDTYWKNPGDSGLPTKVNWNLPEGFHANSMLWPYPERFVSQSLVGFGYTHSVLLMTEITPPKHLKPGQSMDLSADVSWLACKESCVPGSAKITLTLPVQEGTPEKNSSTAALFSDARKLIPQSLSKEEGALTLASQKEGIVLNFHPKAGSFSEINEAVFIPDTGEIIDHGAPQTLEKGEKGYTLSLKWAHPEKAPPSEVKGILLVSEKGTDTKKAILVDSSSAATATTHHLAKYALALVGAFFGGLILNIMPCVLPVVALKIFSFVKMAQEKRSTILKHGALFTAGVMVSFWALTSLLLVLRAYGEGVGWGFQLQEPVFVVVLTLVLFLLGLSLFGLFEMGTSLISLGSKTSSTSSPALGSFLSGVLATVVATPCTGPLLGPALGFAMTLPSVLTFSIFSTMALGMASPYLFFSAFPKLVKFLPRPGNWMIVFKQLMGFLMMATCLWLIWVFAAQTDLMATFILLGCLLVLAVGAWVYGQWATPMKRKMTRMIATFFAACVLVIGGSAAIMTAKVHKTSHIQLVNQTEQDSGDWQSYSMDKVNAMRAQGKSVFIDFTAKWCLICQANKVTLHSADIMKAFNDKNVVTMQADWTKRDAYITEALEKLGRTGVPVYVLYPADTSKPPLILPQTLTKATVNQYLSQLDSSGSSDTVYAH